jgi:hypothetical protein
VLIDQSCTGLDSLKQVVSDNKGQIKYFASWKEGDRVMVIAQARDKLSPNRWCQLLGCRLKEIKPLDDLRRAVDGVRGKAGFEEHGEICKKQHHLVGVLGNKRPRESEAARPAGTASQAQIYKETERRAFEIAGRAYERRQAELKLQHSRMDAYDKEEHDDVLRLFRAPSAMPKKAVTWADVAETRQRGADMAKAAYSSRMDALERELETPV